MSASGSALVALVFATYLFTHWPITAACDALVQRVGFAAYQWGVAVIALAGLVVTAVAIARQRTPTSHITLRFFAGLLIAVAIAQPSIVLINIENVHFPQYALLAILVARAGGDVETAWLGATVLGAADEAYQFLFLEAGRPDRLDWNDITFNAIGAAIGVALLLHFRSAPARPWSISTGTLGVALAPVILFALVLAPPVFHPFYSITPHGLSSHELRAGEGIILVSGVWLAIHDLVARVARRQAAVDSRVPSPVQ